MEYSYYLEQVYQTNGKVAVRLLSAAQAEALGYEDDYTEQRSDGKLYVNGFGSKAAAQSYLSDMVGIEIADTVD